MHRRTIGLLQRCHVKIDQIKCVGKQSNSLEDLDAGLAHSQKSVYTKYSDPKRSEWITKISAGPEESSIKATCRSLPGQTVVRALIDHRRKQANHIERMTNELVANAVVLRATREAIGYLIKKSEPRRP